MNGNRKRAYSGKTGKKTGSDFISVQLHGVSLVDESNTKLLDDVIKTYNSASRCAFKKFQSIGLKSQWKKTSKNKKFWSVDKELGSPIHGTISSVGDWVEKHGYCLDSTLLHNAVMNGYRTSMSFERQHEKWQTSKLNPSFGEIEDRSRKRLTKEEFQLTRNASLTVIGKAKVGNPKFSFDIENCTMSFTFRRKRILFSFKSHRFSKKGLEHFTDIVELMENGELPVTVTLTKTSGNGKFNVSLAYSASVLSRLNGEHRTTKKKDIVAGIWFNDDIVHHQIMDMESNRTVYSKTYRMENISGGKRAQKYISCLEYAGRKKESRKLKDRIANKTVVAYGKVLDTIFNVNRAYHVSEVVVEDAKHRSSRHFNSSYVTFNKCNVQNGSCRPCSIPMGKFTGMIQGKCHKNCMKLTKVDGSFIQLRAIMISRSMPDAIRNACTDMTARSRKKFDIRLTDWANLLQDNPSMLDWVGHLIHNKRSRQARMEIKKAFQTRAVEKAVRLLDNRYRLCNAVG